MPAAVLSILQALVTLGPPAFEALAAIINALHSQQQASPEQEAVVGKACLEAMRSMAVTKAAET